MIAVMTAQTSDSTKRVPLDTLPIRLIALRHELGLSQREAAKLAGITFGVWQGMEAGRNSLGLHAHIARIAAVFGYDRDWLLWGGPLVAGEPGTLADAATTTPDIRSVNNRYLTRYPTLALASAA